MTNVDHQPAATDAPPSSVFFSYSRDDRARALPIIRQIEAAGFPTWWDGLLEGGERYLSATEAALDRARAVVVLWTGTSAKSHWVHDEATRGRDRGILVPLSLDNTEPPLGFGQFQVIDMSRQNRGLFSLQGKTELGIDLPKGNVQQVLSFNCKCLHIVQALT